MLIFSAIFFQVLIFASLIYVFRRLLTRNVISATKHLEELSQAYDKREREVAKQREEIKQKSEHILSQARTEAEKQRARMIKESEEERSKILSEARTKGEEIIKQADRSREALISELEERIAKESIEKACELIQSILPEEFKQDVHSHWIEDLIANGFKDMENLNVSEGVCDVKIISAFPLTSQDRGKLHKKIKSLFGSDLKLNEEVNAGLVAGVIVKIGSLVLDGSLRNRIQTQAKNISEKVANNG